jgi:hypothetical protein
MKIFGYWLALSFRKLPCNHQFSHKDVINMTIDPQCIHCNTPLSKFQSKAFTVQDINSKLSAAGYGNQFCLNVVEALCK